MTLIVCVHFYLKTFCLLFIVIGCRRFWTYLFAICRTAVFEVRSCIPKRRATQVRGPTVMRLKHRFGASPSPCRRVGKPSEKGLRTKWLKCVGPLGSITAAEKHSNTKHWLNNMIIIPIEVFRKYLYNFGV